MTYLTDEMFDEQVPANDESGELADCNITVYVRRSGFGHSARKFRVTQSCVENIFE